MVKEVSLSMQKVYLNQRNWKLENDKVGVLEATVPGCVHTDLLNNKKIEDMYWRNNPLNVRWIEDCDWTYSCDFDAKREGNVSLVFEGLDTYSSVYLNGEHLGDTDNMFIPHEFNVSGKLKEKDNNLTVIFKSPIKAVENMPERVGAFTSERINTRRMQCTYSWDWVDRFVTCGIYRDVFLKYADDMYVENIYVNTQNIDSISAQIYTELTLENYEDGGIVKIEILSPEGKRVAGTELYSRESTVVRRFDIKNPQLWYPYGYGEQPLYTLRVTVGDNVAEETFGIRTLKIVQLEDEEGSEYYNIAKAFQDTKLGKIYSFNETFSGFQVVVNGLPIFCKGANWVPCEPFPSAETNDKISKIIRMLTDIDGNFIRVWGGGIFEKDEFYYECDKNGILVAQDFLMACGTYPEKEEWFLDALRLESEYAVKKLRNHPCLAWWHGDNENAEWGSDTLEDFRGRDSALRGVADQIYKYDKQREFLPSSPSGGNTYSSATRGTAHTTMYCSRIFKFFQECKGDEYKEFLNSFSARFVSEEPVFGGLSTSSLLRFLTEDDVYNDKMEEMMRFHTKPNADFPYFYDDIKAFCEKVFGKPITAEDRLFQYRYLGYEWLRVVFENYRRSIGYCNGLVFWMLNDCWPAALGWAMIDYYNMPKSLYYAFKRTAQHVSASVKEENEKYKLYVSNDSLQDESVHAKAYLMDLKSKQILDTFETNLQSIAYSTVDVLLPWNKDDSYLIICDIKYSNGYDRCSYKQGNLKLNNCSNILESSIEGDTIKVKANGYVHAVELMGEYIFSDNYFTMLPGEVRTISFEKCDRAIKDEISVLGYTL